MNKKMKSRLKAVFDAPAPTGKTEFLQSINFPKISRFDFILGQIGYIRKKVWIISCLLVTVVLFALRFLTDDNSLNLIWIVSSLLPFISLMTITEIARSVSYNMAELEMSCRYNFAGIVLTRLGILSCFNILVFAPIILSFPGEVGFGIFRLAVYLFVPFMLTCSLSLYVLNRLQSGRTTYICCGISCFVVILNLLFTAQYSMAFSEKYFSLWGLFFIILSIFTVGETIKLIKKTEELQWNLL